MKKIIYSLTTILLSAAVLSLSSCLKDPRYLDFAASGASIELPLEAYNGVGSLVAESYNISSTPTVLPVAVNVAAPSPFTSPLAVTLAVDTAAVTAYNNANGTSYTPLPAADFSVSSYIVTIPANTNLAYLNININTNLISPSGQYILAIKIANASGKLISVYNELLYAIQVKNQYDGQYTVTGTMTDVTNSSLTGSYPATVDLITQSANSVAYFDTTIGGYAHAILNNGSASYYGSFAPVFTFDPTTNKVTAVTNYYGQPASNTRSARIDVTGINALSGTPGTVGSVIQVKYVMVQTSTGGDRTFFNETFTYVGSR